MNPPIGKNRWTVVALLFFATTINYLDRQVIGLLKPVLEKEFTWSALQQQHTRPGAPIFSPRYQTCSPKGRSVRLWASAVWPVQQAVFFFPMLVGYLLDTYKEAGNLSGGYSLLFVICGCAYLLAWGIMHFFAPKMEVVDLK